MKTPLFEFFNKPSGVLLMDGKEVGHTRQCCHCTAHFLSVKGSGKRRGFCTMCKQITCGNPACDPCIPYEERLELAEGKSLRKSRYADTIKALDKKFPNIITLPTL